MGGGHGEPREGRERPATAYKDPGNEKMGRRAGVCIDMIMVTAIMAT